MDPNDRESTANRRRQPRVGDVLTMEELANFLSQTTITSQRGVRNEFAFRKNGSCYTLLHLQPLPSSAEIQNQSLPIGVETQTQGIAPAENRRTLDKSRPIDPVLPSREEGAQQIYGFQSHLTPKDLTENSESPKGRNEIDEFSGLEQRDLFCRLKKEQARRYPALLQLAAEAETYEANGYRWGSTPGFWENYVLGNGLVEQDLEEEYQPAFYVRPQWHLGNLRFEWDMREEERKDKDPTYRMKHPPRPKIRLPPPGQGDDLWL
ncbi:hypothetical protein F4803DRAFT_549063 [Xylaria telfairii]|nr:hypothetical protein F4803DRAFT_549063 [Xylaria telfairii]